MLLTKIENENGLKIDFLGETPCSKISFGAFGAERSMAIT